MKSQIIRGLAALFSAAVMLMAGQAHAQSKVLPASLYWQETSQWCWAASGQTIMNYLGPRTVPQCYQANQEFNRTDCCNCPTPSACVSPGWPQFSAWNYNSSSTAWGTPLTLNQVMGQINGNKPFMFSWAWNGGGAHAMVGKGYLNISLGFFGKLSFVYVDNPWPPQGRCGPNGNTSGPFGGNFEVVTYAAFVGGPGFDHTHGADIFDVAPR